MTLDRETPLRQVRSCVRSRLLDQGRSPSLQFRKTKVLRNFIHSGRRLHCWGPVPTDMVRPGRSCDQGVGVGTGTHVVERTGEEEKDLRRSFWVWNYFRSTNIDTDSTCHRHLVCWHGCPDKNLNPGVLSSPRSRDGCQGEVKEEGG